MSFSTFSGDFIDTTLYQLGASKIKVVGGKQHVVDFDFGDGLPLTYIFTITNENRFYLQRARPYPMVHGRFASEKEIIAFIKKDSRAFRNAKNSRNYQNFVAAARDVLSLTEEVEQMFMDQNISPDDLSALHQACTALKDLIHQIAQRSPAIEHGKKDKA